MPPVRQNQINKKGSVFPEGLFEVGCYRYPIPVSQPVPAKHRHLRRLIKEANKDASLRYDVECVLFFYQVQFDQVVFELDRAPDEWLEHPVPVVRVRTQDPVSPLNWLAAAGRIAKALSEKGFGMFLVDIVSADKA